MKQINLVISPVSNKADWLLDGFSISPLSLPLQKGVFIPKSYDPFEGLFGVFSDRLPDGWGRLLVGRLLAREKINPMEVDSISRLAIVGATGMDCKISFFRRPKKYRGTGIRLFQELFLFV